MRRTTMILVILLAWAGGAHAADSTGKSAVKGVGGLSCSRFVQEFEAQSPAAAQLVGWMMGYLSAYNQYADNTFDIASWEDTRILGTFLNANCKRFPDIAFAKAVQLMVQALHPNRVVEADELLVASAGDQKTRIYKGTLMRVQQKLTELELYKGSIDGTYGDKTRFAITEFQQSRGLNVTGIPDQVTLLNLLRGKES